jgi:hypothetical protein
MAVNPVVVDTGVDGTNQEFDGAKFDIAPDGTWWSVLPTGTTIRFYYSTNEGATWTLATGNISGTSPQFYIDESGFFHLLHGSGVQYRRGTYAAGTITWSAATSVQASANFIPLAMTVHQEGDGWAVHLVSSEYWTSSSTVYCWEYRWQACLASAPLAQSFCSQTSHGHSNCPTMWSTSTTCPWGGSFNHTHEIYDKFDCTIWQVSHNHSITSCSIIEQRQYVCGSSTNYYAYAYYHRITLSASGTPTIAVSGNTIGGNYSSNGHTYGASIQFEGTGISSKSPGTKNFRIVWAAPNQAPRTRYVTYSAGSWTFGADTALGSTGTYGSRLIDSYWDGTRHVTLTTNAGTTLYIYDNATLLASRTGPNGSTTIVAAAVMPDDAGNVRVFAIDTTTYHVYHSTYVRATSSWTAWTLVFNTVQVGNHSIVTKMHNANTRVDAIVQRRDTPFRFYYVQAELLQSPPLAPNLLSPVSEGAFGNVTFTYQHVDQQGDPQARRAFRIRLVGSPTWNYWNGSAFTTTETYQTTAVQSVTIPESNLMALGGLDSYEWTVSTGDSQNVENGPYATPAQVNYRLPRESWGDLGIV